MDKVRTCEDGLRLQFHYVYIVCILSVLLFSVFPHFCAACDVMTAGDTHSRCYDIKRTVSGDDLYEQGLGLSRSVGA